MMQLLERKSAALLAVVLMSWTGAPAAAQIRCPSDLTLTETPIAPPGMRGESAERKRPLLRAAVFDGLPSEKRELSPTRSSREGEVTVQVFDLPNPRQRPSILVCRYSDTPATLTAAIPATIKRCVLRFVWNAQARRIEAGRIRPQTECG
jgi:hypothetical protein